MEREYKIKIIVATHKQYRMPDDTMYLPLHVGAEGKVTASGDVLDFGYQKDNTGENISVLNPCFCELTGLYWAWKNLDEDYIGVVHYRRHFGKKNKKDPFAGILTYAQIKPLLGNIKIFVPKKRRYFIETLYSHYAHTHYAEHLDETEKIIEEMYPEYLASYRKVARKCSGYMFNMMIMEKSLLDEYCEWLFAILFALRDRVCVTEISAFQQRFYGRVSEIIFNAWLDYQIEIGRIKPNEFMEMQYVHLGKIHWNKKACAFLMAKFFKRRYEGSF